MRLGPRRQLLVYAGGAILAAAVLADLLFGAEQEAALELELRRELERTVEVGALLLAAETASTGPALSRAVARLAPLTRGRLTLYGPDRRRLFDSGAAPTDLAVPGARGDDLPELRQAMSGSAGYARRRGLPGHEDSVAVARALPQGERVLLLRVEEPLALYPARGRLRLRLALVAGLGLVLAGALVAGGSRLATRELGELVLRARRLAGRGESADAAVSGLAGSLRTISGELERTVELLARERNRFESVLRGLSEAVLVLDAERRISLVNDAASRLLRLEESPVGKSVLEAVRSVPLKELVDRAEVEGLATAELELPGPNGRTVRGRVSREVGSGGLVVVLVDVSELRRLEAVRRDFVANVSHELRTPVSVIRATVDALAEGGLEDRARARGFLDALSRHAERISRLVEDLLDLSRLEAGQYKVGPEPVDLGRAVEAALAEVSAAATKKGIQLESAMGSLLVQADPRALEQILVNLLDNAVKYTPAGGHVWVRAEPEGDKVRLEVADDGPGIERRHRERIFERFYRVDPGRSREMGGTGLGLSIVKHLAEAMGGQVGMEPRDPRGSRFWLCLPRALTRG